MLEQSEPTGRAGGGGGIGGAGGEGGAGGTGTADGGGDGGDGGGGGSGGNWHSRLLLSAAAAPVYRKLLMVALGRPVIVLVVAMHSNAAVI
jgi:hypothetical protein